MNNTSIGIQHGPRVADFIGTVNMLHRAGYYSAEHIARVPSLSLAMLLAFELGAE